MKYNRRKFVKTSATYGAYSLFLTQLVSCKSDKKTATEVKNLIKKIDTPVDAPYQMDFLRGDVGFFNERGGTIGWLANKDGVVIVDSQFPEQARNLVSELKKVSDHPIDLLINTHHHGDHTSGNTALKELTPRILAHANSKKNQERVAKEKGTEDVALPNDIFTNNRMEEIGGERIKLQYYTSAHTDGDITVHFQNQNIVHMGDLVFNRRFPYIDKSSGANIASWTHVLNKIVHTYDDDTKFIFGHAGKGYSTIGTREDIKAFQNYLEKLMVFGKKSLADGKKLEDLIAETKVIPGAPEWTGDGIERSLEAVYQELKG